VGGCTTFVGERKACGKMSVRASNAPCTAMKPVPLRQKHTAVPSSDRPPIPEWASPTWYTMRLDALQASDKLSDADAQRLVNAFDAKAVTLPCAECRENYVAEWAEDPFTLAHARSLTDAVKWVEDLRVKIESKAKKLPTAVVPATVVAAPNLPVAAVRVPQPAVRPAVKSPIPTLSRSGLGLVPRPAVVFVPRGSAVPQSQTLPRRNDDTMLRNFAVRSSIQETVANRAGRRVGCNCGRK